MLSDHEATTLLTIARETIINLINQQPYQPPPLEETALNQQTGCFVTIKQTGDLRGCIGCFQSEQPLYREVSAMAAAAASKDPRFHPMEKTELDDFTVEISILSPLEEIEEIEQIQIGRHGLYLEKNFSRGVLLPQVASEHNWNRTTFLQQTCLKAGLHENSWKDHDTNIFIFSAQIIKEKNAST